MIPAWIVTALKDAGLGLPSGPRDQVAERIHEAIPVDALVAALKSSLVTQMANRAGIALNDDIAGPIARNLAQAVLAALGE